MNDQPLAERLRPEKLEDYIAQDHLLGKHGVVTKMINSGAIASMIFWGPPGVGKTTLAQIIANSVKAQFFTLSAISAGVKEVREIIKRASGFERTILFIDEIHRFNKSQQDALLGAVEKGAIRLIGATTENPSFEVNAALLSRCQVYVLNSFDKKDLVLLLERAKEKDVLLKKKKIEIKEVDELFRLSGGDARKLLNLFELAVNEVGTDDVVITNDVVTRVAQTKSLRYDKGGDMHYDVISAFIKSIRGSDPNAAVYWLARMLEAGEDPKFIARRILIAAAEDIGLANPTAMIMANNCFQSVSVIGMPEARILLSQTVIYLATSPKSNSAYEAINKAQEYVRQTGDLPVPLHLRGGYTKLNKDLGYGKDYKYAHAYDQNFVKQEYLPQELSSVGFYAPSNNARENDIAKNQKALWDDKYSKK